MGDRGIPDSNNTALQGRILDKTLQDVVDGNVGGRADEDAGGLIVATGT